VLLNDPQFIEAARALAERILKEHPNDLTARVREAFLALVGRTPDDKESSLLCQLFEQEKEFYTGNSGAAEALLAIGESKADQSLPRAEFAATAMLASGVMNLDEFVMER
jgi:hypothetical protein